MNALETALEDVNIGIFNDLTENFKNIEGIIKKCNKYTEKIYLAVRLYQETGKDPGINLDNWETSDEENEANNQTSNDRVLSKENIDPEVEAKANKPSLKKPVTPLQPPPEDQQEQSSAPSTRSKRNAFLQATTNIQEQSAKKLNAKLRRPTTISKSPQNIDEPLQNTDNCYVKMEKLSLENDTETMPAPARPAPRTRARKKKAQEELKIKEERLEDEVTSVEIKQEKLDELSSKMRFTDVVVQEQTLTVITLDDSSESLAVGDEKKENPENIDEKTVDRSTRSKRSLAEISDDENAEEKGREKKRSKSGDEGEEDTLTRVPDTPMMDSTIVVEKPKYVKNGDDMIEDSSKLVATKATKSKQIFSPFEQSPVKKKVEAFERLNDETARTTRTKTRSQTKDAEVVDSAKSRVKEMIKTYTPLQSKFIPKATSKGIKPSFANSIINDSSVLSSGALKAPRDDYRERERKRLEKEENLRKREALIQAQMDEKRRKREERQLKAQQTREALEKEKLKALELQKLKEERHRQLVAEQEERKRQIKEEAERKRLQAKLRANEEKIKEEQRQQNMARKDEETKRVLEAQKKIPTPVYMKTRPPRLPTQDCYDSDEEGYDEAKRVQPDWATFNNLYVTQKTILAAGEAVKNTFFSVQAQSADLREIFEVIKPNKLKRTSSAIWTKPPRFTMIPGLEHHEELWEEDDY